MSTKESWTSCTPPSPLSEEEDVRALPEATLTEQIDQLVADPAPARLAPDPGGQRGAGPRTFAVVGAVVAA